MRKFTLLLSLFLIVGMQLVNAQKLAITGTVTSADDGKGIPGVTVMVKGTTIGVTTNIDGYYEINVPSESKTLVFSFVGMKTKEIGVAGSKNINVVMERDVLNIEGVVVTAIGIKRETKALGYSVQEVGSKMIEKSATGDVLTSLEGKVSGVQIINSSGAAGAATYLTIRGRNSITGDNTPLYVIDGVPIDNSQYYSGNPDDLSNNLTTGVAYSNRAMDLNPDDIASISVLKGGAATALYGLQASNGVIVITTKKGAVAQPGASKYNVSISSNITFEKVSQLPKLQNQWAQGLNGQWKGAETGQRNSWGPKMDTCVYMPGPYSSAQDPFGTGSYAWDKNGLIVGKTAYPNGTPVTPYDNLGNFFKTGMSSTTSVAVSGGTDISNFYLSLSNTQNNGVVPKNFFGKTTVDVKGETKLSKKVSVSAGVNYINDGGRRIQQGSNLSGLMLGMLRTPPSFDNSNGASDPANDQTAYMFPDGTQRSYRGYGIYDNPYWTINNNVFKDDVNRMIGSLQVNYLPVDWVTVTYRLGNDFYSDRRKDYFAVNSSAYPDGQVFEDQHFNSNINSDLIFTINRDITKDIKTNIIVGQNMYQTMHQQVYVQGDQLAIPGFYHVSNSQSILAREFTSKKRTAAFYGDLGLSYQSMVFVDITGRNEWSTALPADKNSFFFPSASMGFVFTELPFLRNNSILPYGKVRFSIAGIAKDAPTYYTQTYYSQALNSDGWTNGVSFPFQGLTGFTQDNTLGNNKLKPEKLTNIEFGTELKFWQNRLSVDFTYYDNKDKDLILLAPVAGSSGFTSEALNAASMENKGIELLASITPVKLKDWEWILTVNYTKNKNMVTELAPGVENVGLGGFTGAEIRAVAGEPYGSVYGTQFEKDNNGNVIIVPDAAHPGYGTPVVSETETSFGTTQPKWVMGITNSLKWKQWFLSFLIDIKTGGIMWDGTRGILNNLGTGAETNNRGTETVLTGVQGHLDANGHPVSDGGANTLPTKLDQDWYTGLGGGFAGASEQFVEKADWVRLREVTLSYTIPMNLTSKIGFKSIDLFFTGRNLFLSTPYKGVDPETNLYGADNTQGIDYFNMPGTKTYTFGLRATL